MENCPNCGADVPPGAKACPECGSDEETGWSDQARYDQLDLSDQDFDHAEFVQREFGAEPVKPRGLATFWWISAILLLAGFVFLFLRSAFPH